MTKSYFFYHQVPRDGTLPDARVAELVDAHVSGACSERSAGSSPVPGTKEKTKKVFFFYVRDSPFELSVDGIRSRLRLKPVLDAKRVSQVIQNKQKKAKKLITYFAVSIQAL